MTISIWSVKAGVYTALTNALVPALADIVQRGRPVDVPPLALPRRVYIGDVTNDEPQPVWAPGAQTRLEDYVIPLLIDVVVLSGNLPSGHNDAEAALAAIVAGIELAQANDPSWGATCHNSGVALVAETTTAYGDAPGGSGWRSGCILNLHVRRNG